MHNFIACEMQAGKVAHNKQATLHKSNANIVNNDENGKRI